MSKAKLDELLSCGAEVVGGTCTLDGKEVGRWANGEFYAEPGMEAHMAAAKKKRAERAQAVAAHLASTVPVKSAAQKAGEDVLRRLDKP